MLVCNTLNILWNILGNNLSKWFFSKVAILQKNFSAAQKQYFKDALLIANVSRILNALQQLFNFNSYFVGYFSLFFLLAS